MKKVTFLLAAALGFNAPSFAENMNFSGTVATTCSFSNPVDGVIALNTSSTNILTTNPTYGGNPAAITLNYYGAPTMTLTPATGFTSSPSLPSALTVTNGVNSSTFGNITNMVGNDYVYVYSGSGAGNDTIAYAPEFTMSSGDPFPTGSYAATGVITCQ